MLKLEDFTKEFVVNTKTDRDAEIPVLLEFLQKVAPIDSLLDIGAHYSGTPNSYAFYAPEVRKLVKRYDGIDILEDFGTRRIVDNYYMGNAITYIVGEFGFAKNYDVVICVSTLEHAGISTYKAKTNYKEERDKLFGRCLELAKKYVWLSFPVGQEYLYPNELAIIDKPTFESWKKLISNFKVTQRFFYTQGAQAGHPWHEHNKEGVALRIPYIDFIGSQSICVWEIAK